MQGFAKKVEAKSLVDAVTERLEEAIIGGELAPGERIREQTLAASLGVSRGPLREAIRRLEGRRLLDRKINFGVRVAELSPQKLDDLLTVREALEGIACRIAADRMSDAEIDEMRRLLDGHAEQREVRSGEGYYVESSDFDFHSRIAASTQNELLTSMVTGDLYDLLRVYRYKSSTMAGRAAQALEEHRAILDALAARDPELAEQSMRTHIRNARKHAKLALEKAAAAAPAAE
ncbi:GntR family transcriptional regulator [Tropicimonas sp. IMCC34011]|uniref:GntR family transcriptional regulator n=1 Tax=Tropicimonas sp. IMCC34011 TaxID=2248759 RepID=UPI000E2502DE|nr:GntR family transcriptional regulator [Tropicimonas sp. IMCC34011]